MIYTVHTHCCIQSSIGSSGLIRLCVQCAVTKTTTGWHRQSLCVTRVSLASECSQSNIRAQQSAVSQKVSLLHVCHRPASNNAHAHFMHSTVDFWHVSVYCIVHQLGISLSLQLLQTLNIIYSTGVMPGGEGEGRSRNTIAPTLNYELSENCPKIFFLSNNFLQNCKI